MSVSRLPKIISSIHGICPDIACFQELDSSTLPIIEAGICKEMSRAVFSVNESLPARDGCGVFYNPHKFELVGTDVVKMCNLLDKHLPSLGDYSRTTTSGMSLSRALYRETREKLNMAVFAKLKHIDTGKYLTVGSSHLYWNPAYPDIKLLQAYILARESVEIAPDHPVVLGVDLNSVPLSSGVYELLMGSGIVEASHRDHPVSLRSKNRALEGVSAGVVPELRNPIPFRSAMKDFFGTEPQYTNYTANFKGCLDYIMLRGDLRVSHAQTLPDEAALAAEVALPNSMYPSDHLPLVIDLEFNPDS